MKPFLFAFLVVLGLPLLAEEAPAPQKTTAAELLSEQDFEAIAPYLPGWGAGYKQVYKPATAWKEPFTVAPDSNNPHCGVKAVKIEYIQPVPGDKIFHSKGIAIPDPSKTNRVRIRFFYRLTGIPAGSLHFMPMGINTQTNGKRILDKISLAPSEEWQQVEYVGNLDAGINQVQLIWTNTSDKAPGALFIDDVAVDLLIQGS